MSVEIWSKTAKAMMKFVMAFPILSWPLAHFTGVPFPPMSDLSFVWRFVAVVIIGLTALSSYQAIYSKRTAAALSALAIVFGLAYGVLSETFVQAFPLDGGASAFVITGELRPGMSRDGESDSDVAHELIKRFGRNNASLELIFTKASLIRNRALVFGSYVVFLSLLHMVIGAWAKQEDTRAG